MDRYIQKYIDRYIEINGQIYRGRWIDMQKQMDRLDIQK